MKRCAVFPILVAGAIILSFVPACLRNPSPEEIKSMIEIVDIETKWVSKYYQPWPPKLILVPAISFKVKNISNEPIRYVNFNAIFKFKGESENLGDNFLAAIRNDPIQPGELSDVITLKSNFGVEGKSLASFKDNPQWKTTTAILYAQSRGSVHVLLGEWDVSRKIDFKEPEPVGTGEKVKKEEIKE